MLKFIRAKIFIVILLNLCLNSITFAIEDCREVDLKEAIDIALENNIDLFVSKMDLTIAENNIKSAGRYNNPEINLFYNFGEAGSGNPQQLGLSQTIEIAKIGNRKRLARAQKDLVESNIEYKKFILKMDVREAYIDLIAYKTILKCLKEQYRLLEELRGIAQRKFQVGSVAEMDLIQADIALNEMEAQVNSAKANVKVARNEFNRVINAKGCVYDTVPDGNLSFEKDFIGLLTPNPKEVLPSFEKIVDMSLDRRFDIKIAKREIDVAKKTLKLVSSQRIPDIEIAGGYAYQSKKTSDDGTFQNGAYASANLVNIPLFYMYKPEIKNARIQVEQSKLNYESVRNKAIQSLEGAWEKFVTARLNINHYTDRLLNNTQEMIRLSKRSYQVGKVNLTSLIVMEQSYRSVLVGYTLALSEYYHSWIDFLREVNTEDFRLNEETL